MSRVLIIAEAGVNHNGSLELAKQLIDAARDACADIVKFQTFNTELIASKNAPKAEYQKKTTSGGYSQHEMLKRLELDRAAYHKLFDYCRAAGIEFLSSAFDLESAESCAGFKRQTSPPSRRPSARPSEERVARGCRRSGLPQEGSDEARVTARSRRSAD